MTASVRYLIPVWPQSLCVPLTLCFVPSPVSRSQLQCEEMSSSQGKAKPKPCGFAGTDIIASTLTVKRRKRRRGQVLGLALSQLPGSALRLLAPR